MNDKKFLELVKQALAEHDAQREQKSEWLDMREVCQLLHVQRNAVYARVRNENNKYGMSLPIHKSGGKTVFRREDVEKFIK